MPLNFTRGRADVEMAFLGLTGDTIRYGLEYLSHALDSGVNVAMVYGDRDFRCNCKLCQRLKNKKSTRTDETL